MNAVMKLTLTAEEVANDVGGIVACMEETVAAMYLLREVFEDEGYKPKEFEKWEAASFMERFTSLHLSTYNVLLRDLEHNLEDIKRAIGEDD